MVLRFFLGQKWASNSGTLYLEVVGISDDGRAGIVEIKDSNGNLLSKEPQTVAGLQAQGQWTTIDQ